jgi:hypothetical protein
LRSRIGPIRSRVATFSGLDTIRQEIFLKAFGKDACGREHAIIRQKGCFVLGRGSI